MSELSFYVLRVSYIGTSYSGWQVQANQKTIQGEINKGLTSLAKGREIKSLGAGRTDAGVHAWDQRVKVELPFSLPPEGLLKGLNSILPDDIKVLEAKESDQNFHPIRDNYGKEYRYYFSINGIESPFQNSYVNHLNIRNDSFIEMVEEGCSLFVGTHQFQDFYCQGSEFKTWKKTIYSCNLIQHEKLSPFGPGLGPTFEVRVSGNGFLKQMVRLMVGTLWELGKGNITKTSITESLSGKAQGKLGPVAAAKGLHLAKIFDTPIK